MIIKQQSVQVALEMKEAIFLAGGAVLLMLKNKKKDSTEGTRDLHEVGMASLNKLAAAVESADSCDDSQDAMLGMVEYAENLSGGGGPYDNHDGVQTPLTTKIM